MTAEETALRADIDAANRALEDIETERRFMIVNYGNDLDAMPPDARQALADLAERRQELYRVRGEATQSIHMYKINARGKVARV